MIRKSLIGLLLIGSMILSLTGCGEGNKAPSVQTEQIELLEPVSASAVYEEAALRSLYGASVYAASVFPYTEEYTAVNALLFRDYKAYPGEKVKKGQEIIASDTTNIDEQIKNKEEYIANMQEDHEKYLKDQQKAIDRYREDQALWNYYVEMNEKSEPAEFLDAAGTKVNPEYVTWKQGYDMVNGRFRIAKHAADTVELQVEQRKALFELDLKHQKYLLQQLKENRRNATVVSEMDGTIVAMKAFNPGNYIGTDTPVVAVADLSRKMIRCDFINKSVIRNAKDVYAMINGVRYEVEYQALSTEEYQEMTANGGKAYSTFLLKDVGEEVEVGSFAVISVISNYCENAVTVPKGAIHRDESGSFVYVLKDGKSVYTSIQTGFSDGNYTEITYGLEAGDKVVYTSSQKPGTDTVVLEKGEFHTEFTGRGLINYPSTTVLKNPVENGTVYYGEAQVSLYQHVNKGDVIATVRVAADNIALKANETRLARLLEKFAYYKEQNKENKEEEYYIAAVENYEKQIADLEDTIAKQKKDFATKQIVADRSGVIVELREMKAEDIVQRDMVIARIADESTCYVVVDDNNQALQYGNQVEVLYQDENGAYQSAEGTVVSMSRLGVSASLQQDNARILLPQEKIGEMMQTPGFNDSPWSRFRYTVKATLRSMENVVVVPKRAVYDMGGKTYVYVKSADGSVKLQSFVSGGYNDQYYWVVEGLTEGMEVCLK